MLSEPLQVVAILARIFDHLKIRYVVGGSLASSLHGIPRATQDVDLITELMTEHADLLINALKTDFYVDSAVVREAIARRGSFNVVHWNTMFKADVFIASDDAWSREEMGRARREQFETPEGPIAIQFASAEDTLLHKLVWYRLGNEVSERQWRDILGVLRIQGNQLDQGYLDIWAKWLNVSDFLLRARQEQEAGESHRIERPGEG